MKRVLFVCMGNICRSPAAEGILRHLAQKEGVDVHIESCGMGNWYEGALPDERMRTCAKTRGFVLSSKAQVFKPEFLESFDYILAADHEVLEQLYHYAPRPEQKAKIHLMTAFSETYKNQEVPDPFYKEDRVFDLVLDIVEDSCEGLLEDIKRH